MGRKTVPLSILSALLLLATFVWSCRNGQGSIEQTPTATAARRALKVMVSTNGVIEPVDRSEIFAPIDGLVAQLPIHEGDEVAKGQLIARLESHSLKTSLIDARAALLQARRQAQPVLSGPSAEELAAIHSSIAEDQLQLQQLREALRREEALLKESATTRVAVENLRERVKVLEVQLGGLKEKKEGLLHRYTAKDREWELKRLTEMEQQVKLIEQQLASASILAPHKGVVYSLSVKPGLFIAKGQVVTEIFVPGRVRLRGRRVLWRELAAPGAGAASRPRVRGLLRGGAVSCTGPARAPLRVPGAAARRARARRDRGRVRQGARAVRLAGG